MASPENKRIPAHTAVNIALLFIIALAGGIASLILPKATVSEIEKRELAKRPAFEWETYFAGRYTRELESYYADTFPARERLLQLSAMVDQAKGLQLSQARFYDPVQQPPQSTSSSSVSETEESPQQGQQSAPQAPEGDGYTAEGVFVYEDKAFSLFGHNPNVEQYYASIVNGYAEGLEGVQVYNLLIPTAGEFYMPKKYAHLWQSQKQSIDSIYSQLSPKVKAVDAYSQLESHKGEYLYLRTDHHWTARGSYQAYSAFAKAAGFTPVPLEDMTAKALPHPFLGTQYNLTRDKKLEENPDTVEYFMPHMEYQAYLYKKDKPYSPTPMQALWAEKVQPVNSYSMFLYGDLPLIRVDTKAGTGRKVLMVKESFGNAFAPYLISHFDQVFVADQRYFQTSLYQLVKEYGITDVLFINNIFAANTRYHADRIRYIAHQVWTPPQPEESSEAEETSQSQED